MATEAPVSIDSCDAWKSWGGLSRDDFTTAQSSGVEAKAATAFELHAMVRGAERGAGCGAVKIAGITGSSTVLRSNPNLAFGVQAGLCREAAAFLVFNLEVIRRITVLVIESIDGLRLRLLLQDVPVPVQSVQSVQSDSSRKPIKPLSGPCGFVYSATNYLLKIPSDLDFLTTRQEEERNGEIIETVETTKETFGESSVRTSKPTASKRQTHPPSQPPSSQKQRRREARQERERLAQAARVEARLKGAFCDVVGDWMGEGVGGEGRKGGAGGAGGAGGGRGSIGRNPFVLRSSCSLILHRYISQKVLYCIM